MKLPKIRWVLNRKGRELLTAMTNDGGFNVMVKGRVFTWQGFADFPDSFARSNYVSTIVGIGGHYEYKVGGIGVWHRAGTLWFAKRCAARDYQQLMAEDMARVLTAAPSSNTWGLAPRRG